jgi:hypothetical protein
MPAFHRYAKYGVACDVYFSLNSPSATSSDRFVTGTVAGIPIVAGDVQISKDGGAVANTSNLPTQVTAGKSLYKLVLTATEMQATQVVVLLVDQTASPAWRDVQITIETKLPLGQISVDATQIGGNTNAIESIGTGAGHGFSATGGNSAGDGFHGVGAGGGSAANFGGSGASISWDDLEGAEPSGTPPSNATFRQILQYLKRGELNYASETAGTRTVYKDDSSTQLFTQTITNDGVTRTRGKAT